jgi:ankyrin repeat protein
MPPESFLNAKQTSDGQTPLHLTIRHAENFQSLHPIKELLIIGADREAKDLLGKSPGEII